MAEPIPLGDDRTEWDDELGQNFPDLGKVGRYDLEIPSESGIAWPLGRDPISSTCWTPAFEPSTRITSSGSTRTSPIRAVRTRSPLRAEDSSEHHYQYTSEGRISTAPP
jgi:hypothetical protein